MRSAVLLCAVALLPAFCLAQLRFARNDAATEPIDFSKHKVIRMHPAKPTDVVQLRALEQEYEMDYWGPALPDLRPVLTILDPQRERLFLSALNASHIKYEVTVPNYQQVVDEERALMELTARMPGSTFGPDYDYTNSYQKYEAILEQIKYLASSNPTKSKYINVGKTYQGREIPAIEVGTGSKVIFIECGIHSREWVTISFGTWVANKLLSDASLAPLIANYKFVIIPVVNVDGYVYTHTTNRLWRKTRSPSSSTCFGADPNRNWDSAFCKQGASTNPCSETYCGKSPFSEVEAQAVADLIKKYQGQIAAYFAVHSYSQLWMYPWGYTNALPPNAAELKRIATAGINAIKAVNGLVFTEGSIANAIYLASGSSADWAYDVAGVKIAFALELRDKGQYGFQLPPAQIKPAIDETWAGLDAAIKQLS